MIRDKNTQIVDITHCPLFCDILSHAKTRDEREEIYEDNYYSLQLVSYELEKYRKLEEQLGCPLEVAFKALKDGIYTKESEFDKELGLYDVRGIELRGLSVISKICSYAECDFTCYYTDYKKTWWLRKDKTE